MLPKTGDMEVSGAYWPASLGGELLGSAGDPVSPTKVESDRRKPRRHKNSM